MDKPYRIYISDPHVIFREGIRKILSRHPEFEISGEEQNCDSFKDCIHQQGADLLLIFAVPLKAAIDSAVSLKEEFPGLKSALLTTNSKHPDLLMAYEKGMDGIIHKGVNESEFILALNKIQSGEIYLSPEIIPYLSRRNQQISESENVREEPEWTEKEKIIIRYIGMGLTNADIARRMNLKIRTIEGHKSRMLEKAGVPNTVNLILYALRHELISLNEL